MYWDNDHIAPKDREREIIQIFIESLANSQSDRDFETDSRPFQCGTEKLLFSTDGFSAEDQFRSHDPAALGWNLVAATFSDILAAGGIPLFYGHTVMVQKDWDDFFLKKLSSGISKCLETSGAEFLGGDLGVAENWSYTGIAVGRQATSLNRRGAVKGDAIYMTGVVGSGNLEAALRLYSDRRSLKSLLDGVSIRFPLRIKESGIIRKYARCCIDTSDGLVRALLDLSRINQKGFRVSGIPYRKEGLVACKLLGKPKELLFLGECGEYELLFTVPQEMERPMQEEARINEVHFHKIGEVMAEGTWQLADRKETLDLEGYELFARNFRDTGEYIDHLVEFISNGKKRSS